MAILFYDHLFNKQEVIDLINSLEEAENQRSRLHQLVDDIILQGLIVMLLNKLKESKHQLFLEMIHDRPYDTEIILFLREHAHPNIEDDIKDEGEKLLASILKDMLP
jgi:hypothetical protein